jgi:predicted helicase
LFAGSSPALAHEAKAVNSVKSKQRFTVIIGNPPYAGISSNMTEQAQRIVDAYKFVDGHALNERKLWLQDDYVKFIRTAQTMLEQVPVGVLGYITAHGYFDNPTFRGMRQSLMGTFRCLRLLDLHGNANKNERAPDGSEDKNVFDIRQGVGICLANRSNAKQLVQRADLWGNREAKYAWLSSHSVGDTPFGTLSPDSPYYFFEPQNINCRAEYDRGWKINELMPVNGAGFITARDHFVVDLDGDDLLSRIADFASPKLSDAAIRSKYFAGCGSDKYPDGDTRGWKVPNARRRVQGDRNWRDRVRTCSYRPFDQRYIYWTDWMVDWPRPEVMGHMLAGRNIAFHICRQSISDYWGHVLATRGLVDDCYVSNKSRERGYAHPLYLYADSERLGFGRDQEPNISAAFLKELSAVLGVEATKLHGLPNGFTPEDIFHYIYAVLHSPGYRMRYAEFLKIDFPRLPLTGNVKLFSSLSQLGGELVAFHLLESTKLDEPISAYIGPRNPEVEKPTYARKTVWLDKEQTCGFKGVPEAVWNFHIGGYQVCEKWLKDRKGRTLSKDDIAH